jgi:hypothetical protein
MPQKVTFLVGELEGPLAKRLEETGETPSRYLRRLVAADLGKKPPAMRGQVANLRQYAKKPKAKRRVRQ